MKQVLAFILLLSHVNFAMFIAQVDEIDIMDKNGQQQEDINSLVQYVGQIFHIKHKPLKDTDDDNARYFQGGAMQLYDFQQYRVKPSGELAVKSKAEYSLFKENKWRSPVLEITSPPPKS